MIKVTKSMLNRAENEHMRKEDYPSLVKLHALQYIFWKQQGKQSVAKQYLTSADVKKKVVQLESRTPRRRTVRRSSGFSLKPTQDWGF